MKKIFYILATLSLLTACNDGFLDKKPLDKLSEEAVFNSDALAESYINAIYTVLPDPFTEGNTGCISDEGFFRYGGDVIPEQNNYCGLGTTGGGVKGEFFSSPQIGVRAHIQHLLAYSSTRRPTMPVVDPRYSLVRQAYGSRTLGTWQDLNGRWAVPGRYYGQEILSMFKDILIQ